MASVSSYNPGEQDYRIWLVVNPAKWLFPIWVGALVVALAVHALVFSNPRYDYLNVPAKAQVAK